MSSAAERKEQYKQVSATKKETSVLAGNLKFELVQVRAHVKKDDGRMQAYGWSLPAKQPSDSGAASTPSTASGGKSPSEETQVNLIFLLNESLLTSAYINLPNVTDITQFYLTSLISHDMTSDGQLVHLPTQLQTRKVDISPDFFLWLLVLQSNPISCHDILHLSCYGPFSYAS